MTNKTFRMTLNAASLRDAIREYLERLDTEKHWIAVRVGVDGKSYVSQEITSCYSESEYYCRMPHAVTVVASHGWGQCILPEDWAESDDCIDIVSQIFDSCLSELKHVGYDVVVE